MVGAKRCITLAQVMPQRSFAQHFLRLGPTVLVAWLGSATRAQAYCPQRTCEDVTPAQAERDPALVPKECETVDTCIVEGHQLFWGSKCLMFGVSGLNASALGVEAEEFRDIVEDAFKVWQFADCGGGTHPGFSAQGVGLVDGHGRFFCEAEPTANLSVWSLVTRWDREPNAVGYASSRYNTKDGEIFDSDVELNLNKILREHQNNPANYPIVVGAVALHEAGHVLGLAHSQHVDTVMEANYETAADFFGRKLTQDDIDGICALYPPLESLECSEPGFVPAALDASACEQLAAVDDVSNGEGCTVSAGRRRADIWIWLTAFLVVALRSRLRRRASRLGRARFAG